MTKYEASILPRLLAPLLAGLLVSAAYHSNAQAAAIGTYVISDQDGYGMLDCLTQKSDCGKVVADSWCEAHGHGAARAYGPAEDVTASIGKSALRPTAGPGSAIIACNE